MVGASKTLLLQHEAGRPEPESAEQTNCKRRNNKNRLSKKQKNPKKKKKTNPPTNPKLQEIRKTQAKKKIRRSPPKKKHKTKQNELLPGFRLLTLAFFAVFFSSFFWPWPSRKRGPRPARPAEPGPEGKECEGGGEGGRGWKCLGWRNDSLLPDAPIDFGFQWKAQTLHWTPPEKFVGSQNLAPGCLKAQNQSGASGLIN